MDPKRAGSGVGAPCGARRHRNRRLPSSAPGRRGKDADGGAIGTPIRRRRLASDSDGATAEIRSRVPHRTIASICAAAEHTARFHPGKLKETGQVRLTPCSRAIMLERRGSNTGELCRCSSTQPWRPSVGPPPQASHVVQRSTEPFAGFADSTFYHRFKSDVLPACEVQSRAEDARRAREAALAAGNGLARRCTRPPGCAATSTRGVCSCSTIATTSCRVSGPRRCGTRLRQRRAEPVHSAGEIRGATRSGQGARIAATEFVLAEVADGGVRQHLAANRHRQASSMSGSAPLGTRAVNAGLKPAGVELELLNVVSVSEREAIARGTEQRPSGREIASLRSQ